MLRGRVQNDALLFLWAISICKQPSALDALNHSAFEAWYLSNGFAGVDASGFRVAHFTVRQAQEGIGASSHTTAQRAIEKALERDYLARISIGKKGNASLYAIFPLPNICTHSTSESDTNICAQFTNEHGTNTEGYLYTLEPKSVHIETPICTHSLNKSGNTYTLPIHNQETAQADGAEDAAPLVRIGDTCPYCLANTSEPGTIKRIKEAFDLENPKDPSLLACPKCMAKFTAKGTTIDKGRYYR